jgi:phosphate-selective porin OprO/OprP
VLVCVFVTLIARRAGAQTSSPAQPIAGFKDGFFIQTPDGDNRLVIGLVAQTDARFELGDTLPIGSTFAIRKVRPTFTGHVGRYFEFKVMPDFGNGQPLVTDAYLDVLFTRNFRIRTGKDKVPIGHELLQGDAYLLFPERALASSLVPNRDVGIQAQGDVWSGRLTYAAGVFNGVPDGTSSSTDTDTNGAKDLAARVTVQPFHGRVEGAGPWNGLGFQLGGSRPRPEPCRRSRRPTVRSTTHAPLAPPRAAPHACDARGLLQPGVWGVRRDPLGAGRHAGGRGDGRGQPRVGSHRIRAHRRSGVGAWRAARRNFDPSTGQWGAVQVLARYTALTVDRAVHRGGGARRASTVVDAGAELVSEPLDQVVRDGGAHDIRVRNRGAPPGRERGLPAFPTRFLGLAGPSAGFRDPKPRIGAIQIAGFSTRHPPRTGEFRPVSYRTGSGTTRAPR